MGVAMSFLIGHSRTPLIFRSSTDWVILTLLPLGHVPRHMKLLGSRRGFRELVMKKYYNYCYSLTTIRTRVSAVPQQCNAMYASQELVVHD